MGVVDSEKDREEQLKEWFRKHKMSVKISEIAVWEGILNVVEEEAEQNAEAKDEKEESSNNTKQKVLIWIALLVSVREAVRITEDNIDNETYAWST